MEYFFSGTVDRIIFENSSNFFKILNLMIEDTDSDFDDFEIIITGTMADIMEGEDYTFWGQLSQHPKYGQQLQLSRYQRAKPSSSGLIKYFSSDHFKGIGKKTAERIVSLYGDNTIDKILDDPSKLEDINGFSKANREAFVAKLRINYGTEQIIAALVELGLSNRMAFQIYDQYKEEAVERVRTNPYQLVEDIQGIGFKMSDKLAQEIGIADSAPERFRAALLHSLLEQSISQGDTYIEARDLLAYAIDLLEDSRQIECDPAQVAQELSHLISDEKVYNAGTKIFDASLFTAEEGIKNQLQRLLDTPFEKQISQDKIEKEVQAIEKEFAISYDQVQKDAIYQALTSKVFILTGGPGTGKTTVIRGILEAYARINDIDLNKKDLPIVLAAPTGRAARRMNELTGLPSATIHRHLGLNGDNDYQAMEDYLDCDLLVVDEFSMVDTWLANQLLGAISSNTQIIIVGDSDQLPSVGPGQVLADLLKITSLPQIALRKIFRQSADSTIVDLANQMRQGILPVDFRDKKADRSYFDAMPQHVPTMVTKIVASAVKSGIPADEIQILAPMYKGQAGINNLNQLMQELLNPLDNGTEFVFNEIHFRKGDKVLHLVNDAQLNVFNGDIGYITDLIPAKYTESKQDEIMMDFDGSEVTYPRNEWLKITLAYAMSIHKSQGSEFQVVILPITRQSGRMLQRNLIYTAVTRSKSKLILLGEHSAFDYAIKNEGDKRKTFLVQRFDQDLTTESSDQLAKIDTVENSSDSLGQAQNTIAKPLESEEPTILTTANMLSIDPLIGLTDADFKKFFKK
ncbi:SF1B family DNA helicase RecD2 [Streptococcus parauberis]|uniref:ATP-dependent RecD2 DNA helicase n=1 Tax=Streptococcus parauberis KRS-02083 TaxID=1207545 RepID=A0ABN0IQK1_9STRE|nr:ATP-dependent RecD-like DNA helicase [Streptococcus parauberis]AUT05068.1 Exodeoxyribonuclease V [Streptococcus parauberis]EMF48470.1 RecD-like DNA helicase [Streptococcus parauberis KRS-02109]EMG25161.1 RecD-like DNA helicase [Streptococcus parauberis KRS-02083]PIO78126.1 ATP-dependent RecD-like DNA helicase [Streptococcus parauberis]POS66943.1 ATP-dependent RecD-like DNA helicase [Streptococcus parauberis]